MAGEYAEAESSYRKPIQNMFRMDNCCHMLVATCQTICDHMFYFWTSRSKAVSDSENGFGKIRVTDR